MSIDVERLERDLRAAASAYDDVVVSSGAWQANQRRIATRHTRRATWLVAAAAAIVVVLVLVGAAALLDHGNPASGPASGSGGDPWARKNFLGEPVVAETLALGGQQVRHVLVLTDTDGKGPSLCDRFVTGSSDNGGCTSRDPAADADGVAFDWLTGSDGNGLHSVDGAVDDRVTSVQVWMSNGDTVPVHLHPTGWQGTRMFALTIPDPGPTPQRVVAYADASGTVLQGIDLGARFGGGWLPREGKTCAGAATGTWPQPGSGGTSGLSADLWSASASVIFRTPAGAGGSTCVTLGSGALAGSLTVAGHVVVVTGPEIVTVELRSTSGTTVAGSSRKVAPSAGSPFQLADLPQPAPGEYVLVALDASGDVVGHTGFSSVAP